MFWEETGEWCTFPDRREKERECRKFRQAPLNSSDREAKKNAFDILSQLWKLTVIGVFLYLQYRELISFNSR